MDKADAEGGTPRTQAYDSFSEMPPDILASRIVGSLILAEGNLNKYDAIIAHAIKLLKDEHADALAAANRRIAELQTIVDAQRKSLAKGERIVHT